MNRVELSGRQESRLRGDRTKIHSSARILGVESCFLVGGGREDIVFCLGLTGSSISASGYSLNEVPQRALRWSVLIDTIRGLYNATGGLTCKQIAVASSCKSSNAEENVRVTGDNPVPADRVEHL